MHFIHEFITGYTRCQKLWYREGIDVVAQLSIKSSDHSVHETHPDK